MLQHLLIILKNLGLENPTMFDVFYIICEIVVFVYSYYSLVVQITNEKSLRGNSYADY